MDATLLLHDLVEKRLLPTARLWLNATVADLARNGDPAVFCSYLSSASRHARRMPLAPSRTERADLHAAANGLDCERWTLLEALRARLVLARNDLDGDGIVAALEAAFRFADEGEACALYRSLALLPRPERFATRGAEGCRSNMRSVFEATACDTPFPARCFDDVAFRQCVMKAIFIGAPVARILGLERRRDTELCRMALDLADERRSAARPVPQDLWLAVGHEGDARAIASLEREAAATNPDVAGRTAAAALLAKRLASGAAG